LECFAITNDAWYESQSDNLIICNSIIVIGYIFDLLATNSTLNHVPSAYGQNQGISIQAEVNTLDHVPARKVRVGDIDIAYKQLGGNSDRPIVLINGLATTMDMWSPTLLKELSLNHKVIIFDDRGVGKSTVGTKEFSINQFANDTIGLLDALKIEHADILGFSMGSFIAQEIAKTPDRVNNFST
jgi:alpha-beta hydrolase superfamily lysophospholipase